MGSVLNNWHGFLKFKFLQLVPVMRNLCWMNEVKIGLWNLWLNSLSSLCLLHNLIFYTSYYNNGFYIMMDFKLQIINLKTEVSHLTPLYWTQSKFRFINLCEWVFYVFSVFISVWSSSLEAGVIPFSWQTLIFNNKWTIRDTNEGKTS